MSTDERFDLVRQLGFSVDTAYDMTEKGQGSCPVVCAEQLARMVNGAARVRNDGKEQLLMVIPTENLPVSKFELVKVLMPLVSQLTLDGATREQLRCLVTRLGLHGLEVSNAKSKS